MTYAHLNLSQRYQIQTRLAAAQAVAVIAHALGVHRSTVTANFSAGVAARPTKPSWPNSAPDNDV